MMSEQPSDRRRVLYVPPPSHTARVFRLETYGRLCRRFDVTASGLEERWSSERLAEEIAGYDAVVTGWGSPPFTRAALERADRLRIVAHSAGSIKHMFPLEVVEQCVIPRGLTVFSANGAIALNVAEYAVGAMIMVPRRFVEQTAAIRASDAWRDADSPPNALYLRGATVGLVSASTVGREVIRLLRPFDVRVLVYDPYLSDQDAGALGVEKVELDALFERADIVSLHAPSIPATRHMIGAAQLARLRDGALFINTSRGSVLDHDALTREAETGRFRVVLDVTEPEPLPADHPLRRMSNVYLTPHMSGAGAYGYFRIGDWTLEALEAFFAERPVAGAVDWSRYELLA
jgi:phosphoglycerate dehydrogenase-like enzyme